MAYDHRINIDSGVYVEYTITSGESYSYGLGDTITISGRAKADITIKSIDMYLSYKGTGSSARDLYWTINKSIAKGTVGTFTISHVVNERDLLYINSYYAEDDPTINDFDVNFTLCNKVGGWWNNPSSYYDTVFEGTPAVLTLFKNRLAPTGISISMDDRRSTISGSQGLLQYFGGYIQEESLPRFIATFTTDSRDEKLTTSHELVITDSQDTELYRLSTNAGRLATTAIIDLDTIAVIGTLNYTWTVTDSAGLFSSISGTFTILPYVKPEISVYNLQRYRKVLDSPNKPSDSGPYLWTTFTGSVAPVENKNEWNLVLTYSELDSSVSQGIEIDSDYNGRIISIAEDSTTDDDDVVIPQTYTFDAAKTYKVVATLSDMLNSISSSIMVLKAGGYLNVEKTGVAVGQRSTSDASNKKFEVNDEYISYFYGGIDGVNNYTADEVNTVEGSNTYITKEINTHGHWIDGKEIYRATFIGTVTGTGAFKLGEVTNHNQIIYITGGYYTDRDSMFRTLPFMSYASTGWSASIVVQSNGDVNLYLGTSNTGVKDYHVIVYFTKNDD